MGDPPKVDTKEHIEFDPNALRTPWGGILPLKKGGDPIVCIFGRRTRKSTKNNFWVFFKGSTPLSRPNGGRSALKSLYLLRSSTFAGN